jgi:predicted O-methyltransferase YrrM
MSRTVVESRRRRLLAAAIAAGIVSGVAGGAAIDLLTGSRTAALVVAFACGMTVTAALAAAVLLHARINQVAADMRTELRQLRALVNLRPLLESLPLRVGDWAVEPVFAETLAVMIQEIRPNLVVECGSGSSTVVSAACLARLGSGTVVSLDHDAVYAETTRKALQARGLAEIASVVTAPLIEVDVDGERGLWYDFDPASLTADIDLLIVDGPPANLGPLARYPAVLRLQNRLSAQCVILMDDGARPDETAIAQRWASIVGADLSYLPEGKGGWLLRRRLPDARSGVASTGMIDRAQQ